MLYEESIEQLKSLIEHFNNGGSDFNATDIEAIKYLLKQSKKQKEVINKINLIIKGIAYGGNEDYYMGKMKEINGLLKEV